MHMTFFSLQNKQRLLQNKSPRSQNEDDEVFSRIVENPGKRATINVLIHCTADIYIKCSHIYIHIKITFKVKICFQPFFIRIFN